MAGDGMTNTGKRPLYDDDDDDDENSLFVSQRERVYKKVKSEEPEDDRVSFEDPDDSACDAEEDDEDGEYTEKREDFPSHPAYDKHIPRVKKMLRNLAKDALASVTQTKCSTDEVDELRKMARNLAVIPEHDRQTIGLIGNAGEGKSSLVNSLCDRPDLAKALDAGKSCTYVITEYKNAVPGQQLDLSVTVEFFDLVTIADLLSKALDDWHTFYFDPDDTWKSEEVQYHESRAITCMSTFRAIFCELPQFENNDVSTDTLHALSRQDMGRAHRLQLFVTRAGEILQSKQREDGVYAEYFEADSTEMLWEALDPFVTEDLEFAEPTLWPFVKQVTIGVRGSRVLDACTLVDMPGISDTNQVRVDATRKFLKKCDYLMIVARAGRVTTDPIVSALLQQYGKAYQGHVLIVSTKSDENVNHKVATEMARLNFSVGDYHTLKTSSDLMVSELKVCEREKKKFSRSSSKRKEIELRISNIQKNKQNIENSRWELVVKARNEHNMKRLQQERQRYLPAWMKLHVFGVSNSHYEKHLTGEKSGDYLLSPEGTGVPELRHHILRLAAPRVWIALKEFVDTTPTQLIPGFKMWAGSGTLVKNRAALARIVNVHQQRFLPAFEVYKISVLALVEREVIGNLKKNQGMFAKSAVGYLQRTLSPLHWQTLRAFISHNGNHKTSVMSESWNDRFTMESTKVIEKSWDAFAAGREDLSACMEKEIISALQAIPKSLRKEREATGLSIGTFEQGLEGHINTVRQTFRRQNEAFVKEIRTIYINSTLDGADGFFAAAMSEAYESCQDDQGTGWKARTLATFAAHLKLDGARSPFAMMTATISGCVKTAAAQQVHDIMTELEVVGGRISHDFLTMIRKKSNNISELAVRRAVNNFVGGGSEKLDEINKMLIAVEARYPAESLRY